MAIVVKKVKVLDLYNASNFNELTKEYSQNTQLEYKGFAKDHYLELEKENKITVLGAYDNDKLIGFASMLLTFYPHLNKYMGVIESIFITKDSRKTDAGSKLIFKLRSIARKKELMGFFIGLPYTSKLNEKYKKIFHPVNVLYFAKV